MTAGTMTRGRAPQGQPAQPVMARPFRAGVQAHDEVNLDDTRSTTAATQDLNVLNIPPAGFLRWLWLLCTATTAANAAAVTFAANGPFNVYDSITLEDVNSAPIVGPFNGFDLYIVNKFGGYAFSDDAKSSPIFVATTGAGATGGSFTFALRIPVELVNRDALGSLPNKSGNSMFKLRLRLSATATIYGVAPTAAPSVRTQVTQVDWWDPPATDLKGTPLAQNPPAEQTTQFWSKASYALNAGAFRQQLERVGYPIRNLIFILDAAGSRTTGDTDWPDPFSLQFESTVLIARLKAIWRHLIASDYGYQGATAEAAEAFNSGVFPMPFCLDFGLKPGAETRRGYLETGSASRLEAFGTIGGAGAHTLTVLTNDVAPAGGDYGALVA